MSRDDIIRMAREAGAEVTDYINYHYGEDMVLFGPDELTRFFRAAYAAGAAAEREAIIQAIPGGHSVDPQWVCDMIRARGEK